MKQGFENIESLNKGIDIVTYVILYDLYLLYLQV